MVTTWVPNSWICGSCIVVENQEGLHRSPRFEATNAWGRQTSSARTGQHVGKGIELFAVRQPRQGLGLDLFARLRPTLRCPGPDHSSPAMIRRTKSSRPTGDCFESRLLASISMKESRELQTLALAVIPKESQHEIKQVLNFVNTQHSKHFVENYNAIAMRDIIH